MEGLFFFLVIPVEYYFIQTTDKNMSDDFINLEKRPNEKKDITLSILVLVLVFILVFGFVTLREYGFGEIFSTASERIAEEVEERFLAEEEIEEEEEEEEVVVSPTEKEDYREIAQEGDGLTHLARRALTSHMEEEGLDLSDEERIYVEDYVQKRLAPEKTGLRFLEIGEEVEISRELVEEGVAEAQKLTPTQIDNLSQYANQVSF